MVADSVSANTKVNKSLVSDTSYISIRAKNADIATRATLADSATIANRSLSSDYATKAGIADSAIAAHRSVISQFSNRALSATRADTASFAWYADSSRRAQQATKAILADSSFRAQLAWLAINANHAITADSARKASFATRADTALVAVSSSNDKDTDPTNELQSLVLRNDSLILSNPAGRPSVVNLKTETFRAPGASIEYPLGILGDALTITTNYIVPVGKTLYISAVNNGIRLADGKLVYAEPGMPIIPEGFRISECYCTGILQNNTPEIQPLLIDFTSPAYEYLVPPGFTLVIKSGKTDRGLLDLQIDGDVFSFYTVTSQSPRLIVITTGKRVKKSFTLLPSDPLYVTGYLLKNRA